MPRSFGPLTRGGVPMRGALLLWRSNRAGVSAFAWGWGAPGRSFVPSALLRRESVVPSSLGPTGRGASSPSSRLRSARQEFGTPPRQSPTSLATASGCKSTDSPSLRCRLPRRSRVPLMPLIRLKSASGQPPSLRSWLAPSLRPYDRRRSPRRSSRLVSGADLMPHMRGMAALRW